MRVEQLSDHRVHAGIERVDSGLLAGQFGNAVPGCLQVLRTQALVDFLAQRAVGLGKFPRALVHFALELFASLFAYQRRNHMLGNEDQQIAIALAVAMPVVITLHDDRATNLLLVDHRNAHPVDALRAESCIGLQIQLLTQLVAVPPQHLAGVQHLEGEAVDVVGRVQLHQRILALGIFAVRVVRQAHDIALIVVQRDEKVLRIGQVADDLVDARKHVGEIER